MKHQGFRLILIGIVLIFSIWHIYPSFTWYSLSESERETREGLRDPLIEKSLNLGLDLRGGMNLLLELDVAKIPKNVTLADAMEQSIEIIRNRVDQFGVSEPLISRQGDKWIAVQLPGIKNPDRAVELVGKTALLEFKLVEDDFVISDYMDEEGNILQDQLPANIEVLKGKDYGNYAVKKKAAVTGSSLTNAEVKVGGDYGSPYVAITFNKEGGQKFADVTGENTQKRLAIVLDGIVQSAPVIKSRIPDGNAIIEGSFTPEEAKNLAIILKAGALPAPVYIIENRTVGPTLGSDSVKKGAIAGLVGMIMVVLFMLVYYKFSGVIANIALLLNTVIILGLMAYFHATLTLPGIAGIILTIGMAVDANVLICERIKEELRAGKTIRIAVDAGYDKAFSTIMDANITTLIAAMFLFQFGTGPVKGFAVTLTIGLASSMFTAIIVTKVIYELILKNQEIKSLSI
ncbi:MAG: protein translocase subunit SecD [bacterium]|nr:protein translocase subunit SecD [bacterium]